jgi:hypothetical protein
MKRHHALLPETVGMMALQRSGGGCESLSLRSSGQALSLAKETKQSNLSVAP